MTKRNTPPKTKNAKKNGTKNGNESSSSSSSDDDNTGSDDEEDSDDSLSEVERDYDMSAVTEYTYLIGKVHMDSDDKKLYITTRVEIDSNGYVVAFRQPVNVKGQPVGRESSNSYHVEDIAEYTRKSTQYVSGSSTSSSASTSKPTSVDAISNSLKCEENGCNEDQYDICANGCNMMLCAKHINHHGQISCLATVIMIFFQLFFFVDDVVM